MTYQPYNVAPTRNTVGLVALILALLGGVLVFAVLGAPFLIFLAAPALLVAFILAIVGLARKGTKKGAAITALILAVVFGILGPVFFAGRFVADVGTAIAEGSTPAPPKDGEQVARIGEKVKNSAGVAFTVTKVKCGKKSFTDEFDMTTKARGQFCVISVKISNGSDKMITLSTSDITGLIGKKSYEADGMLSDLGGDKVLSNVNPGLGLKATFVIDVPAKKKLEYVQLRPTWSFQDEVSVKVK